MARELAVVVDKDADSDCGDGDSSDVEELVELEDDADNETELLSLE